MADKKTILLIEDDSVILRILNNRLSEEGYNIFVAEDGESGLKKFKENRPDLILLDLILPKMDGISILREIRKDATASDMPVLILTNLKSNETVLESLRLGVSDYILKVDYSPEELVKKVKEILEP